VDLDTHTLTRPDFVDTGADLDNPTGELVTWDVREARSRELASEDLLVSTTHRGGLDLHQRFAATRLWPRHFGQLEPIRLYHYYCLHVPASARSRASLMS
jgi:hypothetical protein